MPEFVFDCQCCGMPTRMGPSGQCINAVSGGICGFSLPVDCSGSNGFFRKKVLKHTNLPPSRSTAVHSCVASLAKYATYQQFVMASGSLHHDPVTDRLFLGDEPRGGAPIADVHDPLSGSVMDATRVMMPLNSRPQDLHQTATASSSIIARPIPILIASSRFWATTD